MELSKRQQTDVPFVKTKIIATVGPASGAREQLAELVAMGVDIFRLNFAHGSHDWLAQVATWIREVSEECGRPIGILGDLSGPKIRLGALPADGVICHEGEVFTFVRSANSPQPGILTSTYDSLIDDLHLHDRVLLADGTVAMRVVEKSSDNSSVSCVVTQPGCIRSRQGINLPGVALSTPSLTAKDRDDLKWAIAHELDFVGLSFVRSAADIRQLRESIKSANVPYPPQIVAKIEKTEAIDDLENILSETDAVMVARGDLGVEVDITRVPILQKQIIRLCNQHRIPVITATQMLDSMQTNELPTRAEASDVANAVLDGSDAVMLSGETAIGEHPAGSVSMMNRICREAERLVRTNRLGDIHSESRTRARLVTEAVTLGASTAAERLDADLLVVATHSGRTAMAVSTQRSRVPILALSDLPSTARRMCLYWGVTPLHSGAVAEDPQQLRNFVVEWGTSTGVLQSGSRLVMVGSTHWSEEGHDMMVVHAIP